MLKYITMLGPVDKKIFIGGLTASVTENEIKERFSKFGRVDSVSVAKNAEGKKRKKKK